MQEQERPPTQQFGRYQPGLKFQVIISPSLGKTECRAACSYMSGSLLFAVYTRTPDFWKLPQGSKLPQPLRSFVAQAPTASCATSPRGTCRPPCRLSSVKAVLRPKESLIKGSPELIWAVCWVGGLAGGIVGLHKGLSMGAYQGVFRLARLLWNGGIRSFEGPTGRFRTLNKELLLGIWDLSFLLHAGHNEQG